MSDTAAPALKEIFNRARLRHIAAATASVYPAFDTKRFLAQCQKNLDDLSLLARLRRVTETLHGVLPPAYRDALTILKQVAPLLDHRFVTMVLPDFVALYGLDDFDVSMAALRYFTPFGSAEFGIRPFLRQDLHRTLAIMRDWASDPDDHVRRLASEGCRPRLPWSFRLEQLMADPTPVAPILDALRADPSLYVRKSVANHLNDITKDHPAWVLDRIATWPLDDPRCAWIAKHAVRSLIKRGDRRALAVVGAGDTASVAVEGFTLAPKTVRLGGDVRLSCGLRSLSDMAQRLVVDYAVHYVKQSGAASAKVFKLKLLTLAAGQTVRIEKSHAMRELTTRVHYVGRHRVDLKVNGQIVMSGDFDLTR